MKILNDADNRAGLLGRVAGEKPGCVDQGTDRHTSDQTDQRSTPPTPAPTAMKPTTMSSNMPR